MTWVHWVLYNIDSTTGGLPEAVKTTALPFGTREGVDDSGRTGYGGPRPPVGRHRYFHRLYALDAVLLDLKRRTSRRWKRRCRDTLAQAALIGTYRKRH